MRSSNAAVSKLLGAVYDAAENTSSWALFLEEFARATQSQRAAILLHDLDHDDHSISLSWGLADGSTRAYEQYYAHRDVWLQKAMPLSYTGWLATSEEICPPGELARTEFYNDYLKQNEIAHALWGVLEKSPTRILHLGLYRDPRKPAYDSQPVELLRTIGPHIARAFRLHLQIADLKSRAQSLEAAIDKVATGIIFVSGRGLIAHMNKSGAALLADGNGLRLRDGKLSADHPSETRQLEMLVRQATAIGGERPTALAGVMQVRRNNRPALQLLVSPARNFSLDPTGPALAAVFVTDPSQRIRPADENLRALFGLSPAECRVALLLCDGHTIGNIAQFLGVTRNTLKTQLASIYRKTGSSRQTELVRLLSQLAPMNTH